MQLTPRDIAILDAVARHRFLDSRQILEIVGSRSVAQINRRLQRLFHNGFLDRPRSQIDYYAHGSRPLIYEIGRAGRKLLSGTDDTRRVVREPVGRFYLQHTLMIAAVHLLFRKHAGSGFPRVSGLPHEGASPAWPLKWAVALRDGSGKARVPICPDLTLAAESADRKRLLLFVEADRGTMPVSRRSLGQTSFRRKLLAYEGTWAQRLTKPSHGIERFRVLTVTRTAARARRLAEECSGLSGGHGLFLFTDLDSLKTSPDVFAHEWLSGRGGTDRIFGL